MRRYTKIVYENVTLYDSLNYYIRKKYIYIVYAGIQL